MERSIEQQVQDKLVGISAMVTELNYRIGRNPYSTMQFDRMNLIELDAVRGELTEILYGDPIIGVGC